ncbi:MAG: ATP-binding cassette domain-containing protein, partial [Desulfobacteraceae bacterium]
CQNIYDLFPILKDRADQLGTNLSGGEQQMLAIGRALMSDPKVILFDELSLGLAPVIIKDIYEKVREINAKGIAVVLVEQDIKRSLKACNRAYVLQEGRMTMEGNPENLTDADIKQAYFEV